MQEQINTNKEIICCTCLIKFDSLVQYKMHLSTDFHVYNSKRRIAQMPPVTEEIYE